MTNKESLKAVVTAMGGEPVNGTNADLIKQIAGLVPEESENASESNDAEN